MTSTSTSDRSRAATSRPRTSGRGPGSILALRALGALGASDGPPAKRALAGAIAEVADQLGNTPAVARASYVHPAVIDAYLDGSIGRALLGAVDDGAPTPHQGTPAEEAALVRLLEARARKDRRRRVAESATSAA